MSNLSQFFGGGQKVQIFTSSGTWVCPAANTKVHVLCVGGGGGGASSNTGFALGGTGNSSSFGALLSANGGTGGRRADSTTGEYGGSTGYLLGGRGQDAIATYQQGVAGLGAQGFMGFGQGGNGGQGAGTSFGGGGGGASGLVATGSFSVSSNVTVTVGSGGAAGYFLDSSPGAQGVVIVWWE